MLFRLAMTVEDFHRLEQREKEDPNLLKPFTFRIMDNENPDSIDWSCVFILNHGYEEGGLYNFRTNSPRTVKEFLEDFGFIKRFPKEHIYILCCHGALVKNELPEKVTLLNNTKNIMKADRTYNVISEEYTPEFGMDFYWDDED